MNKYATKSPTFSVGSSFPARASKRVVFPEDGGPSKSVILYIQETYVMVLKINHNVSSNLSLIKTLKGV